MKVSYDGDQSVLIVLDCGLVRHSRYLSNTVMLQKMYIRRALVLITDKPIYSGFKCVLVFSY